MWGVMVDYEYSLTSYLKLLNDVLLLEQTIHMRICIRTLLHFLYGFDFMNGHVIILVILL